MAGRSRRIEPWPIALALALLAVVGVCIGFWVIAARNPDLELETGRPGLSIPGGERGGRN